MSESAPHHNRNSEYLAQRTQRAPRRKGFFTTKITKDTKVFVGCASPTGTLGLSRAKHVLSKVEGTPSRKGTKNSGITLWKPPLIFLERAYDSQTLRIDSAEASLTCCRSRSIKHSDNGKSEWIEIKPIIDVVNEGLKAAGKNERPVNQQPVASAED